MAAAKKEMTLRFFLERYLGETDVYETINEDTKSLFLDFVMQTINEAEEFCEILQKIEKEANPKSRYIQLQGFAKTVVQYVYSSISNKKDGDSEDCQVNEEEEEELQEAFNTFTNRMVELPEESEDSENSEESAKRRRLN